MQKFKKFVLVAEDEYERLTSGCTDSQSKYTDFSKPVENVVEKHISSLQQQMKDSKKLPLDVQSKMVNEGIKELLILNRDLRSVPRVFPNPEPEQVVSNQSSPPVKSEEPKAPPNSPIIMSNQGLGPELEFNLQAPAARRLSYGKRRRAESGPSPSEPNLVPETLKKLLKRRPKQQGDAQEILNYMAQRPDVYNIDMETGAFSVKNQMQPDSVIDFIMGMTTPLIKGRKEPVQMKNEKTVLKNLSHTEFPMYLIKNTRMANKYKSMYDARPFNPFSVEMLDFPK